MMTLASCFQETLVCYEFGLNPAQLRQILSELLWLLVNNLLELFGLLAHC